MVDPVLSGQYTDRVVCQVAAVAAMCVQPEADYRPIIAEVVHTLEYLMDEAKKARAEDMCVASASASLSREGSVLKSVEASGTEVSVDVLPRSYSRRTRY
jgi:hypothetical protein